MSTESSKKETGTALSQAARSEPHWYSLRAAGENLDFYESWYFVIPSLKYSKGTDPNCSVRSKIKTLDLDPDTFVC